MSDVVASGLMGLRGPQVFRSTVRLYSAGHKFGNVLGRLCRRSRSLDGGASAEAWEDI